MGVNPECDDTYGINQQMDGPVSFYPTFPQQLAISRELSPVPLAGNRDTAKRTSPNISVPEIAFSRWKQILYRLKFDCVLRVFWLILVGSNSDS